MWSRRSTPSHCPAAPRPGSAPAAAARAGPPPPARGAQAWLAWRAGGFRFRDAVVPIVPGAICFDLLNGGNKAWGRFPPYRDLAYAAACAASDDVATGRAG